MIIAKNFSQFSKQFRLKINNSFVNGFGNGTKNCDRIWK